jgi:hypothetical protein
MAQLEERMAKIEGIIGQISERLNHIDTEIGELRKNDRWILGLLFFMWVTMIVSIWLSR